MEEEYRRKGEEDWVLGSIKEEWGAWIIEGKRGDDGDEGRDRHKGRGGQDERSERRYEGCRDHKQRMRIQGRGLFAALLLLS